MPYKDPAKKKANDAAYHDTHREKHRSYHASYRRTRRAEINTQRAIWRKINHERERARTKARNAAHPEKRQANEETRRARKANAEIVDLSAAQFLEVQIAQNHRCAYCGKRFKGRLTQDHITPLGHGGDHTLHNIVAACLSCNARKGRKAPLCQVQPLLLTVASRNKGNS